MPPLLLLLLFATVTAIAGFHRHRCTSPSSLHFVAVAAIHRRRCCSSSPSLSLSLPLLSLSVRSACRLVSTALRCHCHYRCHCP
ncbi:hypothetical protein BHM03_00059361, partial [Ensete ventricosum]